MKLRRWLRPPRLLRPTRAGWCFFVIVFAVGFAALNTGNNLLYLVLSLMLAFLALSGVLSESALRGIRVRRRLPAELYGGARNRVRLEIHNTARRVPSFAIVVEDRIVSNDSDPANEEVSPTGRVFALRVGAGEKERISYAFYPERRGAIRFHGFRVSTRFPFGLFLKSLVIDAEEGAVVYPGIDPLRVPPSVRDCRQSGDALHTSRGHGAMVSGLREFRQGDPLRRVHWKTSLRRGQLLVREGEDEREAQMEVRLRTRGARVGEAFEERVRWAASEVVAHLEAGLRVALRTDSECLEGDAGPRHRAQLLRFLALVQPDPSASGTGASS